MDSHLPRRFRRLSVQRPGPNAPRSQLGPLTLDERRRKPSCRSGPLRGKGSNRSPQALPNKVHVAEYQTVLLRACSAAGETRGVNSVAQMKPRGMRVPIRAKPVGWEGTQREKRARIFRTLAQTFEAQAEDAAALTAIHWLSNVVKTMKKEYLSEVADRMQLKIEQLGAKALGEMHTFSTETRIDRKEVEESIDGLIVVNDPFLALFRLAAALLPRCDELRIQVKEQEKEFTFLSLFPRTFIGHNGLPKAVIGNSENDPEGRLLEEALHFLPFNANVFYLVITTAMKAYGLPIFKVGASGQRTTLFGVAVQFICPERLARGAATAFRLPVRGSEDFTRGYRFVSSKQRTSTS
jgi:hypothetical protein